MAAAQLRLQMEAEPGWVLAVSCGEWWVGSLHLLYLLLCDVGEITLEWIRDTHRMRELFFHQKELKSSVFLIALQEGRWVCSFCMTGECERRREDELNSKRWCRNC